MQCTKRPLKFKNFKTNLGTFQKFNTRNSSARLVAAVCLNFKSQKLTRAPKREVKIQSALASLDAKILAEVEFAHIRIVGYLFCGAAGEQLAVFDDVGAVADRKRFADIVIGDEHADTELF